MRLTKTPVICGPIASGKTPTALHAAKRIDGEIVSADSMQIYRHMDIGTAKPTAAEQAAAPHHMIDIVDPVTNSASSATRNSTPRKMSLVSPRRPTGMRWMWRRAISFRCPSWTSA